MNQIMYTEKIIGLSWEDKINNFVAHMETKFPKDDKSLIHELANNIMVRDLILNLVFKVNNKQQAKLFSQMLKVIEKMDKQLKKKKGCSDV